MDLYLPLLVLLGFLHRNEVHGGMPGLPAGGPPPQPKGVQGPGGISGGGPLSSINANLAKLIDESMPVSGPALPGSAGKCKPLKDNRGVVRYSNDTSIGTVVAFACKEGFEKVTGDDTRECKSDLTWSGKPLVCKEVLCPSLDIANAKANTSLNSFGTVVKFTCNSGFLKVGGDDERRCTSDRIWTGKDIQCKSNTCTVSSIPNAISSVTAGSKVTVGGAVTYSCKTGYKVKVGDKTRKCEKMEKWTGSALQCVVANCPALSVANGKLSTTATTTGTVVDMECNDQYRRDSGSSQRKCVDGQWSGSPLVCKRGRGYQDPPENAATKNCGSFCQGSGDVILVPAGDVDGDGFADLVCYKRSGQIHVASNDKKGGFTCGSNPAQGIESGWCKGYKQKVFVTDFDGDKVADLICHSYNSGSKDIRLRDKGSGNSYSNPTIEQSFRGWCFHYRAEFHVADFDGDGKGDLLCHDNRTGYKWLAKGGLPQRGITRKHQVGLGWCTHRSSVLYVADSNGDGSADIYCHDDQGNLWITKTRKCTYNCPSFYTSFSTSGAHTRQMSQTRGYCSGNTKAYMPRYHLMDFDGDGKADMYCHRTATNKENSVLLGRTRNFRDSDQCVWTSTNDYCNTKGDLLIFGKFLQTKRDDILCIRRGKYMIVRNYGP